jgi:hypothetical protein
MPHFARDRLEGPEAAADRAALRAVLGPAPAQRPTLAARFNAPARVSPRTLPRPRTGAEVPSAA